MKYLRIITGIVIALAGSTFILANTWWCLFISTYLPLNLFCWWGVSCVIVGTLTMGGCLAAWGEY
jgi:hypothetical protein